MMGREHDGPGDGRAPGHHRRMFSQTDLDAERRRARGGRDVDDVVQLDVVRVEPTG